MQINIAKALLETGIVEKVYHSCQLIQNQQNQKMFPAYQVGTEWHYAGVNDQQPAFAYIRTSGDIFSKPLAVGGCGMTYQIATPLRVVVFMAHTAEDFDYLLRRLTFFTFLPQVSLVRIIDDKWRLSREESELWAGAFAPDTFYVAFDVLVNFVLLPRDCGEKSCTIYPNPICT